MKRAFVFLIVATGIAGCPSERKVQRTLCARDMALLEERLETRVEQSRYRPSDPDWPLPMVEDAEPAGIHPTIRIGPGYVSDFDPAKLRAKTVLVEARYDTPAGFAHEKLSVLREESTLQWLVGIARNKTSDEYCSSDYIVLTGDRADAATLDEAIEETARHCKGLSEAWPTNDPAESAKALVDRLRACDCNVDDQKLLVDIELSILVGMRCDSGFRVIPPGLGVQPVDFGALSSAAPHLTVGDLL